MERTVLIIDDSEQVRRHLERALREHEVAKAFLSASNGAEGVSIMLQHPVALVLCDLEMPGLDGFKFLRLKAARAELRDIPVIMITGKEDVKTKVVTLSEGANDYLTKPFHDEELVARARVHIKLKELQDELRQKNALLEQLSRTDGLTGLLNRRYLMELLSAEVQKSIRYRTPLSFIMVDIDHFKTINDSYGHLIGDTTLQVVASVLRAQLRSCDLAGRYGGEEFALVLPQTDREQALMAAERCRAAIHDAVISANGEHVRVTASFGVATHSGHQSLEELVERADQALYLAKAEGRNRVAST